MLSKLDLKNLRFSLQVHLSTIFLFVLISVCSLIGVVSYNYALKLTEASTNSLLDQVNRVSIAETRALFLPAESVANLLSSNGNLGATTLKNRMQSIPVLLRGLNRSENITAVFVGNEQGDFMLVRRMPTDPDL
ncbi:MAG TPA: hypothetical protein DCG04_00815, partial [Rhodospirillaceae bacterium]|nr:hypothetical protein [Rhodospirillaceae bacterium]